jgi:diguanylate cyclase (GGDEF)-like protein
MARMRPASIRGQIVTFAVLAALVPSLMTAVLSYVQNRRALTDKASHALIAAASQAGREADAWLKGRLYDLRVFASSYVMSENRARGAGSRRLADYLKSVRMRFGDYEELQRVDRGGRLIASSSGGARVLRLPNDWVRTLETSRALVTEPYWDGKSRRSLVVIGVPVETSDGRPAGGLFATANFSGLEKILRELGSDAGGRVYLTTAAGRLIADSRDVTAGAEPANLDPESAFRLHTAGGEVIAYPGAGGAETVGSAHALSSVSWLAVADMPTDVAYRQVIRLRNMTLLVVGGFLLVVWVVADRLAALITRPLARLTAAAAKVSAGDLSVDLPADASGELGSLTAAFNTMVGNVRNHRAELERLSSTDGLTGLSNRRHLMAMLSGEVERARRGGQPFSVLMLDVDHFKKYNDEHGHQAGDDVLVRLGALLRDCVRAYDCAARYGGEEFLVMLSATAQASAVKVAERIRERVRAETRDGVTLSAGVAEYPLHGDTVDAVIRRADAALYEAKRAGRNRVACAKPAGDEGEQPRA